MRRSAKGKVGKGKQKRPLILFTVNELLLLKRALVPLEKKILLTTEPLPNLQFALETVTQVQGKIQAMLQQQMWGVRVAFDINEALILKTAVWLYTLSLQMIPSSEQESLLAQYQELSQKLERMPKP